MSDAQTETIDPDEGPVTDAIDAAFVALEGAIEAAGGRVLRAVMIVQADGLLPASAFDARTHPDEPADPQALLDFTLLGVQTLAHRQGLPLAVFDAPLGEHT